MDAIYKVYNSHASSLINLQEYFHKLSEAIGPYRDTMNKEADRKSAAVFDIMNVNLTADEVSVLQTYCSIDNLTVKGEMSKRTIEQPMNRRKIFDPANIPDDIELETVKQIKQRMKDPVPKHYLKYRSESLVSYEKVDSEVNQRAVPGKDFLVYFRIYEPFVSHPPKCIKHQLQRVKLNSVIAALGCQTLAQLRDAIKCLSDMSVTNEISNNPDNERQPLAKDVYKSGFFYIENIFYNDYRDPTNHDNSAVIRKWAKTRSLGPFETARMEETRIDSICARFGYPWVYQHQGSCEHLILLSDARLITSDDQLSMNVYPRIERICKHSKRHCMMCGIVIAAWIVTESDRIPHNICYFCETCFKSFNYIDGKKIGNFKAYRYPNDPNLLTVDPDNDCVTLDTNEEI